MSGRVFEENGYGLLFPWVDLVNSEYRDGFGNLTEFLDDEGWIRSFSKRWAFEVESPSAMAGAEVRSFRAELRRMAERLAAGGPLTDGDLDALNARFAAPVRRRLARRGDDDYSLEIVPSTDAHSWVLAQVAASLAEMLENRQAKRLKACANPKCRWVFYDETRGNIRRWCRDSTCGNRHRVRRFREKNLV